MKIKTTFVAALAALALAGCSKDNQGIDGPDTPDVTGEATYTTFTISITNPNTRAFHGDLAPTPSEAAVSNLSVYIYDLATSKIEDVLTFTADGESKTTLITVGPKQFVATSGITPVYVKGQSVADLENRIINVANEAAFKSTLTQANSFLMASEIVNHTVVSATKEEAESANHHNNIIIKLGRAMAKIGVYYNESINITDGELSPTVLGTMSSVKYHIKNQPNQMYTFTTYGTSGVWKTPYYDRNNNMWSDSHAASYWSQTDWFTTGLTSPGGNHEDPTYMMENSNMTARHGNATYVAIQGVFSPAKWLDANGNDATSGTWNAGDDFWRIAKVELDADDNIVAIKGWKDNGIYSVLPSAALYDDTQEAPIKYDGGLMYYYIYLDSSLGNTPPTTTADKYSQHRNQYWDVEITKVTGLGWNEEDGGRPENPEPLDNDSYIHATIQVMKWEGVYMPGELEGKN